MNAQERTIRQRQLMDATPTFPLSYTDTPPESVPESLKGVWLHTAEREIIAKIRMDGWKPESAKGTTFGAAVYLSRDPWDVGLIQNPESLAVVLQIGPGEVLTEFDHPHGKGHTQDDLLWHLNHRGVRAGKSPGLGHSTQNRAIRDHFLARTIKAVAFLEGVVEVVAVYDPTCIRVLVQP
jgi:hypothetical protein